MQEYMGRNTLLACTPASARLEISNSNMTILPAKQTACDLCGMHDSAMLSIPLENWSAVVL